MKKKIILSILLLFGVCCAGAAGETHGMYVRDRAFNLNARLKNPPKLEDPNSFSIIVFGDPQSYSKFDFNQAVFELMTSWAAVQKNNLNVMTVLCTGDLVEQNGILDSTAGKRYKRCNGNTPSDLQWESVSHAFKRLDGVYPYVLCTGNHDYGIEASENRNSRFPEIFNISRNNAQWGKHLVRTAPNAFGVNTLENAAYEFSDKNCSAYNCQRNYVGKHYAIFIPASEKRFAEYANVVGIFKHYMQGDRDKRIRRNKRQ